MHKTNIYKVILLVLTMWAQFQQYGGDDVQQNHYVYVYMDKWIDGE